MQHYALFRLQVGRPWGGYPIPHAVLHLHYFPYVYGIKNAAFSGDLHARLEL